MADEDKLGMAAEWDVAPAPEVKAEAPKQTFVREIDLGDGSGKQRFEADSYEALVDKFVQAQTNATRKIQELSRGQEKRRREPEMKSSDFQEVKPATLKAEDIQPLQNNPHELFRRMFQAEAGMSLDEFRQRENDRRRQEAEFKAQRDFVEEHRNEYAPTPENAERIMRFLQKKNYPISKANLDYAFDELRGELGAAKPQESIAPPTEPRPSSPAPEERRQVSPPPSVIRPSLGGPAMRDATGGIDVNSAEFERIAQLPPTEMKARIEQLFRQSRTVR